MQEIKVQLEEAPRLQDNKHEFQIDLSNRFEELHCDDTTTPITERYDQFEKVVAEVAEKVIGKRHAACQVG